MGRSLSSLIGLGGGKGIVAVSLYIAISYLIGLSVPVSAALVENVTMGNAKALALGNAVTADPPGVDSIHYNPAGLARIKQSVYNLKLLAASMNFGVNFGGYDEFTQEFIDYNGYVDDIPYSKSETSTIGLRVPFVEGITKWDAPVLVLPFGGAATYNSGSDITFATTVYSPMAAGYIRDEDDPARFMGKHMSMARIVYFSPSIGFQLTDSLSVGGSIGFAWQGVTAATQIRVPNLALAFGENLTRDLQEQGLCPPDDQPNPFINFCGADRYPENRLGPYTNVARLEFDAESALVPSVNIGFLWDASQWFTLGMVYQLESTGHLDGYYKLDYNEEWVNFFDGFSSSGLYYYLSPIIPLPTGQADSPHGRGMEFGKAKLEVVNPAHFSVGISMKVTPKWKLNIDAKWTDWAAWDVLHVSFDKALDFTKLASNVSTYSEPDEISIPRHYKSVWNWAFGVEYQHSDSLALRFGYEPRKSSIPNDKQDLLLPVGDADLLGFGFAYKMRNDQLLEVSLGYMEASASVAAGESTNANDINPFNNFIYNPYAGTAFSTFVKAYMVEISYQAPLP